MAGEGIEPTFVVSFPPSYDRFKAGVSLASAGQKRRWRSVFSFFIWVIIGLAASAALNSLDIEKSGQVFICVAGLSAVLIYCVYCTRVQRRKLESIYNASRTEVSGSIEVMVFDDRIEISTGLSRTIWQWKAVKSVWSDEEFFCFSFSNVSNLLIPVEAFSDQAQIEALKSYALERSGTNIRGPL